MILERRESAASRTRSTVSAPALESREPGARRVAKSFIFDRPGDYVLKVEFQESPGREILSFPLTVLKGDPSAAGRLLRFLLAGAFVLAVLVLGRLAARRKKRLPAGSGRPE